MKWNTIKTPQCAKSSTERHQMMCYKFLPIQPKKISSPNARTFTATIVLSSTTTYTLTSFGIPCSARGRKRGHPTHYYKLHKMFYNVVIRSMMSIKLKCKYNLVLFKIIFATNKFKIKRKSKKKKEKRNRIMWVKQEARLCPAITEPVVTIHTSYNHHHMLFISTIALRVWPRPYWTIWFSIAVNTWS